MRVVVGPHQVIVAPPRELARAREVLEPRAVDVFGEDLARQARDSQIFFGPEAFEIIVPLLENERQPAAFAFCEDDAQLRMAIEAAREKEAEERVDRVVLLLVDRAANLLRSLEILHRTRVRMAG